jgi:N-methylhydantoinase B
VATATHDPVSAEIHRKALENITSEMAIALKRTSGSPVIYEVQDFATAQLDVDGEQLSVSATNLLITGASLLGTRAVVEAARKRGTPLPGDGWIVNDPFTGGALHQGDVGIVMPQFYGGEQIGWSFATVHIMDVGGAGVSGFAPGAKTVFEEGLLFPATQIIRDGELDRDWAGYIAANVRIPDLVLNDIRAMMAANNVAQEKLTQLVDRFGLERFREYCELNKSLSEAALRARIEKLPDGVYETTDWLEFDAKEEDVLAEMTCKMTIAGSELRLDIGGAEQLPAFVNGTTGVVRGAVMAVVLTTLGYGDVPFNAGLWRPLTIDNGPPGTIVNATAPAPLSSGHAALGLQLGRAVKDVLNQALSLSDDAEIRGRVAGAAFDAIGLWPMAGAGHGGNPTVVFFMDLVTGCGGGAQSVGDGQDCYGVTPTASAKLANVETNESQQPILYLWRLMEQNSGGPGAFRGGQSLETACVVYGSEGLSGAIAVGCAETPAKGAGGGLSGSTIGWSSYHGTNVESLIAAGEQPLQDTLDGDRPDQPSNKDHLTLSSGDVLRMTGGGGGGLGDPLLRDPALVAADVRDRYVTASHARLAYGVVIDERGALDAAATEELRAAMRHERIGGEPSAALEPPASAGVSVLLDGDGGWACGYCAGGLGPVGENWRQRAVSRETPVTARYAELGMAIRERREPPPIVLTEHYCGACAGLLCAEPHPQGFAGFPAPRLA